jgi:TolB-like protein/tetratricopeptide (TPR) repeat protein
MADFFAELKRRHIYRVGAAYVVVAWALTQLVEILAQVFTLPLWLAQAAIVLLAVGFPAALLVAWTIESKPHQAVASAVRSKPTIVDWTLCGALGAVLLFMAYQQIAAPSAAVSQQIGLDVAKKAAASPGAAVSLAVLPFANLSGDPNQEFFSDGITEEITSALARVPDLRVVARTSAYQFRDQNRDIQSIGEQLNATHFIEGSVRRAGERVRITVQLILADSGLQVWSENYDRELTDIFAIQEDIARAITTSLRMPLGLRPGENLIGNRKIDPESYEQFLRAVTLQRGGGRGPIAEAMRLLEQVVARNPEYAPAWARLGFAYGSVALLAVRNAPSDEGRLTFDALAPKAEPAVRRALQLDPNLPDGLWNLGLLESAHGKLVSAETSIMEALSLDPDNPDALHFQSMLLAQVGRVKDALQIRQRLRTLEPFVPLYNMTTAHMLWLDGENDAALAMFQALPPNIAALRAKGIAMVYATTGRYDEAADALQRVSAAVTPPAVLERAIRLLRAAPDRVLSHESQSLERLGWVYLYVGAPEQALQQQERLFDDYGIRAGEESYEIWHRDYAPLRKSERFASFARKAGLVDYWRAKGWPEFCRPTSGDDFECN